MQRLLSAISVGVLLFAAGTVYAQDTNTAKQGASDEVRKLLDAVQAGFNSGDAKALAACWTPRGDFTSTSGERIEGRESIENAFRAYLAAHKTDKLKLWVTSFRIASDDLILADVGSDVKPEKAKSPGDRTLLSLVLVKRDGRWLIESARESLAGTHSPVEHLKCLEWLVGDWADQVSPQEGLSMHSSCAWTANRSFLIRKFKIEGRNGFSRRGTEVIGWDPRERRNPLLGVRLRRRLRRERLGQGRQALADQVHRHPAGRQRGVGHERHHRRRCRHSHSPIKGSCGQWRTAARRFGSHHQASAAEEGPGRQRSAGQHAAEGTAPGRWRTSVVIELLLHITISGCISDISNIAINCWPRNASVSWIGITCEFAVLPI